MRPSSALGTPQRQFRSHLSGRCWFLGIVCFAWLGLTAPATEPPPPFRLVETNSHWWLAAPSGERFISKGVAVVTRGAKREEFDPENPGYASWQHYRTDDEWADTTLARLRDWGFTTVGGWSHDRILLKSTNMLGGLTPVLHVGSTAGAPWWDMWDEKVVARMDDTAREQILPLRDDPRLIGYYTDNEMGWWNATLFHMALEQAAESGQRQRLVALLRDTYSGSWDRLLMDFEPEFCTDFSSLSQRGQLWLRPGGEGVKVMRQFLRMVAARYYQLVHDIIRNYDRRALILGDRYQSFYYPEVAEAAAPYVDAISSNLNASWNDGTFVRFHLDTLHAIAGKPIFVSEMYLAATENRSGNRNSQGLFPVAATQAGRARSAQATLEGLARLPYVTGVDWFQYFDEPRYGREDGENFNFGLVDIFDRPYPEMASVFRRTDLGVIRLRASAPRADARQGVPRAPRDPFANLAPRQIMQEWDRERGFVPPSSPRPMADLYVAWKPEAIYLGVFAADIVEDGYYRNKSVPKADRALWSVRIGGGPAYSARIGGGREAIPSDPSLRLENRSGSHMNVWNIALLEIPAEKAGRTRFRAGDAIELDSTLITHGKAYRMEWKGTYPLAR